MLPGMEAMACPDLAVPREIMQHVVRVESSFNPYAIGVVGGHLVRQPKRLDEAVATVRMLEEKGYNFSVGLAQVNRYNLGKYGLDSYARAFEPCANLQAGSRILAECYQRSGRDWGKAFSCYYSGNFVTGFRHGYVQKVYASMREGGLLAQRDAATPAPIRVIPRAERRTMPVTRFPVANTSRVVASQAAVVPVPAAFLSGASPPGDRAVAAQAPTVGVAIPTAIAAGGAPPAASVANPPSAIPATPHAAPEQGSDHAFVF